MCCILSHISNSVLTVQHHATQAAHGCLWHDNKALQLWHGNAASLRQPLTSKVFMR